MTRSFDLGAILVPGHSFQFMCTPEDQVKALETFKNPLSESSPNMIWVARK